MVAACRAAETEDGGACNDPWARHMVDAGAYEMARAYAEGFPAFQLWIAVRTAFLDEQVRRHIERGCRQIVILGAGFDSRAARLSAPDVRFFEVDTPGTQAEKRERVQRISGYPQLAATYVTCNFESQSFVEQLVGAGFDTTAPAFIIWEGVSYYLSESAVRNTLTRIAEELAPDTVVAFDFLPLRIVQAGSGTGVRESVELVRSVGEPFIFGINYVIPLLYDCGFRRARQLTFDEAWLSLSGRYDRDNMFRFQFIALASVAYPVTV